MHFKAKGPASHEGGPWPVCLGWLGVVGSVEVRAHEEDNRYVSLPFSPSLPPLSLSLSRKEETHRERERNEGVHFTMVSASIHQEDKSLKCAFSMKSSNKASARRKPSCQDAVVPLVPGRGTTSQDRKQNHKNTDIETKNFIWLKEP